VNSAINELYQQVILEHNKKPRNFKRLSDATHCAEGYNPLCGDHIWIDLKIDALKVLEEISFDGQGCAICKASASMMTVALKGKSVENAKALFTEFHDLVKGELKPERDANQLGKLTIFSGVWQYPSRVKCAALAWHTMNGALDNVQSVSTEQEG
jgi:nitrogen fixation NifU-like protein